MWSRLKGCGLFCVDSTAGCSILCVLSNKQAPPTPDVAVYLDRHWHVQGDGSGRLYLWDMRKIISSCAAEKISTDHTLPYGTSCSLTDSWEAPALPCCLTDTLVRATPLKDTHPGVS